MSIVNSQTSQEFPYRGEARKILTHNEAQIDAETGEVIQTKKPWWAFLASEQPQYLKNKCTSLALSAR